MNTPDKKNEEPLSPLAVGYMWSTRIMTIAAEMGLIVYAGYYLDGRFGTKPILILISSVLALTVLFVQLAAIVRSEEKKQKGKAEKE